MANRARDFGKVSRKARGIFDDEKSGEIDRFPAACLPHEALIQCGR
jgi:hypothetical protein